MTSGITGLGGTRESSKITHDTALHAIESAIPVRLPDGRNIVTKEQLGKGEVGGRIAASWLGQVLGHTYGRHQLTSSVDEIEEQIRSGKIEPIFIEKNGEPDACAALIHGAHTVEIGRAANAPQGGGGAVLMWRLARVWEKRQDDSRPLVAEIRMAAPFDGIDGGQGSQATLLHLQKVGMVPHAFLPAFHHPGKIGHDRQEIFCFASKEKKGHESARLAPSFIHLPEAQQMNIGLLQNLLGMNGFETQICLSEQEKIPLRHPIGRIASVPFHLLTVDPEQIMKGEIDWDWDVGSSNSPFELLPIDARCSDLAKLSNELIHQGFICAGISAPHEGPLHLLFARLHKTTLAPTQPIKEFPGIRERDIMNLHQQFASAMV